MDRARRQGGDAALREPGVARVALVDDDARYRQGLETLLGHAEALTLGASFAAPGAALRELERRVAGAPPPWDLVLLDIDLPGLSGIEATRRVKALAGDVAVVVLTVFEEPGTVLDAICAGADGYLLKATPAPQLLAHLRSVVAGGSALAPDVARTVLDLVRAHAPALPRAEPTRLDLTDREHDVLRALVQGLPYRGVAEQLGVSLDTVRTHVRGVYRKLQVHNVAEAVGRAIRQRLV